MPNHSSKRPKRPRDVNQLAKAIGDAIVARHEQADEAPVPTAETPTPQKDPAAVSLGRRGGLKGGAARAAVLTAKERSEIAKKAARARWKKERG